MSAPAHTELSVQQFLTKNSMTPMPHHPYSPDLTPSNFSFFSADEKSLQRKNFADVEVVKQKTAQTLKGIKIDEFKSYLEQWEKHLKRHIASNGEYFEGS